MARVSGDGLLGQLPIRTTWTSGFWRNPFARFALLNEAARRWAVRAPFVTKTKWVTSISLVGPRIQANGMLQRRRARSSQIGEALCFLANHSDFLFCCPSFIVPQLRPSRTIPQASIAPIASIWTLSLHRSRGACCRSFTARFHSPRQQSPSDTYLFPSAGWRRGSG
jgi:hypothetical protein